jgi:hypothetical protein
MDKVTAGTLTPQLGVNTARSTERVPPIIPSLATINSGTATPVGRTPGGVIGEGLTTAKP